jgi:hypothetical protein
MQVKQPASLANVPTLIYLERTHAITKKTCSIPSTWNLSITPLKFYLLRLVARPMRE